MEKEIFDLINNGKLDYMKLSDYLGNELSSLIVLCCDVAQNDRFSLHTKLNAISTLAGETYNYELFYPSAKFYRQMMYSYVDDTRKKLKSFYENDDFSIYLCAGTQIEMICDKYTIPECIEIGVEFAKKNKADSFWLYSAKNCGIENRYDALKINTSGLICDLGIYYSKKDDYGAFSSSIFSDDIFWKKNNYGYLLFE